MDAETKKNKNKEYFQKWYKANREKKNEQTRLYLLSHPEVRKKAQAKYYENNKERRKELHKVWKRTLKGCLSQKLYHLKKNKYEVAIATQDLLDLWEKQEGKCAISHYLMTYAETGLFGVSVDRIDSNKGYIRGNIQLVCQAINFAKNKYSNEKMLEFWNLNKETYNELS